MGRVQAEHCVTQMTKGSDGRKDKSTSSLHVFLSVSLDCTFQMTSDEKKLRYRSALLQTMIHGIWDVDDGAMGEFQNAVLGRNMSPKLHQNKVSSM